MNAAGWWIVVGWLIGVGGLIAFAVWRGRKAHRKAEEEFRNVACHNSKVHRVYRLAIKHGATEDEAWEAARAYEKHYTGKL